MTHVLVVASVALLIYNAAAYTIFALRYGRLTWKGTREGRHLMGQSRVLAALLWTTLLMAFAPPVPRPVGLVVQVVMFAWLAFEATRRNRLLTLNQRDARQGEERVRTAYRADP